jgi:hypothetical protein
MAALPVLLAATAAVAAARSTWSPCGLSMLSTITPMGERARRYTYGGTAAWFVLGGLLGGASLGAATAALAWAVGLLHLAPSTVLLAGGALALVGAASDGDVAGFRLPGHRRQVNEVWLDRYRSWVYGAGFGWQIGVGLSTFIVTAAVYLVIALAALTGEPLVAFLGCTGFGFLRGLAVLLSRSATTVERLQALHRRFDELSASSWRLTIAAQLVVGAVALLAAGGPVATGLLVAGASVTAGVHLVPRQQRQSSPA